MRELAIGLVLAACLVGCSGDDDDGGGSDSGGGPTDGGGRTDGGGGGGGDSGADAGGDAGADLGVDAGGTDVQGSCDVVTDNHGCIEYSGFPGDPSQIEAICTGEGGTYTAGEPCDRTGAAGGCRTMSAGGFTQTTWYYAIAASEVQTICDAARGVFLTP